jgi:hypothetical protein
MALSAKVALDRNTNPWSNGRTVIASWNEKAPAAALRGGAGLYWTLLPLVAAERYNNGYLVSIPTTEVKSVVASLPLAKPTIKIGHSHFQNRPLRLETGQHPRLLRNVP